MEIYNNIAQLKNKTITNDVKPTMERNERGTNCGKSPISTREKTHTHINHTHTNRIKIAEAKKHTTNEYVRYDNDTICIKKSIIICGGLACFFCFFFGFLFFFERNMNDVGGGIFARVTRIQHRHERKTWVWKNYEKRVRLTAGRKTYRRFMSVWAGKRVVGRLGERARMSARLKSVFVDITSI